MYFVPHESLKVVRRPKREGNGRWKACASSVRTPGFELVYKFHDVNIVHFQLYVYSSHATNGDPSSKLWYFVLLANVSMLFASSIALYVCLGAFFYNGRKQLLFTRCIANTFFIAIYVQKTVGRKLSINTLDCSKQTLDANFKSKRTTRRYFKMQATLIKQSFMLLKISHIDGWNTTPAGLTEQLDKSQ